MKKRKEIFNMSLNLNFLDLKKNSNRHLVREIIIRTNLIATDDGKSIKMQFLFKGKTSKYSGVLRVKR